VFTQVDYDPNFGTLTRKKTKFPLDGIPLVIGVSCLLKQFHPAYTEKLLSCLGQYVRSSLQDVFFEADTKAVEVPKEVINILVFMEQLCLYSSIPRSIVYNFVPPYIFDALKIVGVVAKK
jgi:hypothetical protein